MKNYTTMVKKMKKIIKNYFNNGTEAFSKILKEYNFKKQSEVIVPVTLCKSIIDEIISCELKPVFCDIDDDFIIKDIESKITKKTKMIVFVEQYGFSIKNHLEYYNKSNERIIKVLDACQSNIKRSTGYDYIIYSFNKNKPISIGKYSMVISKKNIPDSIELPIKIKFKLIFEYLLYYIKFIRKLYIKLYLKKNLKIKGYFINHKNMSLHRIVFVMNISKKNYERLDNCLYEYLNKYNINIVQTTIEINPYEELKIKEEFPNFEKLRYKTLYFRSVGKINDYKKVVKFINEVQNDKKNKTNRRNFK